MKRILLCFCVIALTISCSRSDDNDTTNPVDPIQVDNEFFALKVGNSWVYKSYEYNSFTEAYDDTGVVDEISIVGTEEQSGNTFFKFRRVTTGNEDGSILTNPNGEYFELLRAADGNLLREDGSIKFTKSNFEERLLSENDWGSVFEILIEGESTQTVEAGEFVCVNSEKYAKSPEGERLNGVDRFYYSDGVGLIYDSTSFVNDNIPSIIRRLDSFEIQ